MGSRVETVLQSLTLEEKISLLAGKDFWETVPIPDKGVPAIKVGLASTTFDFFYSD
jgi:beta-glucosidase